MKIQLQLVGELIFLWLIYLLLVKLRKQKLILQLCHYDDATAQQQLLMMLVII